MNKILTCFLSKRRIADFVAACQTPVTQRPFYLLPRQLPDGAGSSKMSGVPLSESKNKSSDGATFSAAPLSDPRPGIF